MKTANPKNYIMFAGVHPNHVWVYGVLEGYTFSAKVYCIGSDYGIHKGRTSKLLVHLGAYEQSRKNWIANYDRGWDVRPTKEHQKSVDRIIGLLEGLPQPEVFEENMCFSLD